MNLNLSGNISSSIRLNVNSPLIDDFTQSIIPIYLEQTFKSFGEPWRITMKEGQIYT